MTTRPRKPAPGTPAPGKLALPEVGEMKRRGDRIVMVTAYDAPSGRIADDAGVDLILVGDSAAMVVLGHDSTVPGDDRRDDHPHARGEPRRAAAARDRRPAVRLVPGERRAGARDGDPVPQGGGRRRRQARRRRDDALARPRADVGRHPGDGPHRPDAADRDDARRFQGAGPQCREGRAALRGRARARGSRLLLDRARGRAGPRRGPHHRSAVDPDDRHRRRGRLRRPGARLARHARPLRRQVAALREAVRGARADDSRRGRAVRGRGA